MSYDVRLTQKAERQLRECCRWWAENRSTEQADRWYAEFSRVLTSLEIHPERPPLAQENDAMPIEIRELRFGLGKRPTHRAIFAIRPDRVVVYAIRHLAQADLTLDDL